MFSSKFFYFLKGYVIIEACGVSIYSFISECADKGIKLYNVRGGKSAVFSVFIDDFYDLYVISKKYDMAIKIKKDISLYNVVSRHKKRIGFVAGFLIFILFFIISSGYLWDISVDSEGEIDEEIIIGLLSDIGIKPGMRIKDLPDSVAVKNHLVNSLDNVPWAWMYVDGVRARVSVHQGIIPPEVLDDDEPCDIVASKDGFIIDMSVKKGVASIVPGNVVSAGDVLISGLVEVGPEENKKQYTVRADGEVNAYTYYNEDDEYSLVEDRPRFSGKSKTVYTIKFGKHKFDLFSPPEYDYSIVKKRKLWSFGFVDISKKEYLEAEKNIFQMPREWVIDQAKRDLTARIGSKLGKGARLQSQEYITEDRGNKVYVKAQMEFIENIGVCVPR